MSIPGASFFALLFGLVLGSFLNVVIYRYPRGQSIITPRSHCTRCRRSIRWYDNIPLASYLLLRGKCRFCRKPIPFRYPLVEILTGLFSLLVYLKFGCGLPYFFYFLLLVAPLIAIAFIDLDHMIIPDLLSLSGIPAGILATVFLSGLPLSESLLRSFFGILAGGITLFLVSWGYEKLRHQEGIGGGDIKLAAMLGAFFGWKGVFAVLFFSSLLGSLTGLFLIAFRRKGIRTAIPYGPFLAAGALLNLFFGNEIIHWYVGLTTKLY